MKLSDAIRRGLEILDPSMKRMPPVGDKLRGMECVAERHGVDPDQCSIWGRQYGCVLPKGHEGPHVACTYDVHNLDIWEDD